MQRVSEKMPVVWSGESLKVDPNNPLHIFVFGSNPEGRHGMGAALEARKHYGAIYGRGRGFMGQSYALVTKNLTKNFVERVGPDHTIKYRKVGGIHSCSMRENILELYQFAFQHPTMLFFVPYKVGEENLNGYSGAELACMFFKDRPPENVIFHRSLYDEAVKQKLARPAKLFETYAC